MTQHRDPISRHPAPPIQRVPKCPRMSRLGESSQLRGAVETDQIKNPGTNPFFDVSCFTQVACINSKANFSVDAIP
jgi:hypothetical protein